MELNKENPVNCWNPSLSAQHHNVSGNGQRDGLKRCAIEEISSQAAWKQVEGSTTISNSPNVETRAMKRHERGTAKAEDIVWTAGRLADVRVKRPNDNKTNSVPFSGKLDDLSKQPVEGIIRKILADDANKTLDAAAHAQFDATLLLVYPDSGNSATAIDTAVTGTAGETNALAMSNVHVKLIVDEMKERNIPAWPDGNYRCIGRPATFRDFKDDIEALHSYVDRGFTMILNGEIGRDYSGCRFFEQTNIASESWTKAVSDAAYFFGADTVMEAICIPEEIRGALPSDYGRSRGVAWLTCEAYA